MATRTLIYHFTLQSPWSYLGHAEAMTIARRHDLAIRWKPTNLAQVFPESGGLPLAKRHPKRQAYRDIELQRWRLARTIPLNLRPAFWPVSDTLADRCIVALVESGADPDAFVRKAFAAIWAENRNVADRPTLEQLLADTSHVSTDVLAAAESERVKAIYDGHATEALEAGVFGAPTYILDGEPFWGQDRLALLDDALTRGREPFTAVPPRT